MRPTRRRSRAPSIIPASSSMKPSSVRAEPRPAPKMPDPSSSRTAVRRRRGRCRRPPAPASPHAPPRGSPRDASPWSGGAMSNAPPWTAIAGVSPLVDVMCPVSSPMAPVALRPWPVIARTTVPAVPPIADRARPACAAADVGSTNTPCASRSRMRVADLVIGDLDDVAAGLADRGEDLARSRRPVDPDAFGDRRGRRHGDGVGLAGSKRASERRARIALDADQPRDRSIMPAARSRPKPRWAPRSSVPPPRGATTASGAVPPSCSKTS